MKQVVLVGFRGVGKSTIGARIAEVLDLKFFDLDLLVESKLETTITEFVDKNSFTQFAQIECETLQQFISQNAEKNFILATGGATCESSKNRELLRTCAAIKIQLDAPLPLIHERLLATNAAKRIGGKLSLTELRELYSVRRNGYHQVADVIIESDTSIQETVKHILNKLSEAKF